MVKYINHVFEKLQEISTVFSYGKQLAGLDRQT